MSEAGAWADPSRVRWRVGRNYGIHVYTDTGDRKSDRPVATFMRAVDARAAVRDHNANRMGAITRDEETA